MSCRRRHLVPTRLLAIHVPPRLDHHQTRRYRGEHPHSSVPNDRLGTGLGAGKSYFKAYIICTTAGQYVDADVTTRTIGSVFSNDLTKSCQQTANTVTLSARASQLSDDCLTNCDSIERPSHQTPASNGPGSLDKQRQLLARDLIPVESSLPELQGVLSKTRLYGPAHYKSSFEQV